MFKTNKKVYNFLIIIPFVHWEKCYSKKNQVCKRNILTVSELVSHENKS